MSEDICYTEAFTLSVSDFVKLLKPEHLPGIKSDVMRLFRQRIASNQFEDDATQQQRVSRYVAAITASQTISDVSNFLISMVKDGIKRKRIRFEKGRGTDVFSDDGESEDEIPDITLIRCISRVVLPVEPQSVILFLCYRDFQWDGPYREPLLRFDADYFFERRLTGAGVAMARILGKTDISLDSWVERH